MFYVVTYDIPCHRRRRKVAQLLEGYGCRVQYSVFECVLSAKQFQQMQERLRRRIKLSEDSVRFYPLSAQMQTQVICWGGVPLTQPPEDVVI